MSRVERYVVLDGWRGICAILVALFHFPLNWHFQDAAFVRGSWMFVDFFFVLSGFVIAHAYAGKLSSRRDLAAFVIRRFGRLWPLHVAFLLMLVAMAALKYLARGMGADIEVTSNPNNTLYSFVTNVLFLHSFGLHDTVTWNTPSWSISAEFLANILFGVAFVLLPNRRVAASLALSALAACVLLMFSPQDIDTSSQFGLFRCIYGFFIGCVVHRLVVVYGAPLHGRSMAASWAELAVIAAVAVFVAYLHATPWRMAAPFVFALAIWVFAAEQGAISRWLQRPAFVVVGLLSYSIYMTHMMVITAANNAVQIATKLMGGAAAAVWDSVFASRWTLDAMAVAFVAVIVASSWVSYTFIEVPGRRRFNRIAVEISPKREAQPVSISLEGRERLSAL